MDELTLFIKNNPSIVVSVCALFLTIYQARATWKHNRLSVQPRLTTSTQTESDTTDKSITLMTATLANSGLGPAIIKSFEILLNGKPMPITEPEELSELFINNLTSQLILDQCITAVVRKNHVLSKDSKVALAKLAIKNATIDQLKEIKKFHVRVVYESAYGQSFTYDSRNHKNEA